MQHEECPQMEIFLVQHFWGNWWCGSLNIKDIREISFMQEPMWLKGKSNCQVCIYLDTGRKKTT